MGITTTATSQAGRRASDARRAAFAGMALAWAIAMATPIAGQETSAFVATLGNDTIAVERWSRTGRELTGTSVIFSPRTTERRYTIHYGQDGAIERFEQTTGAVGEAPTARQSIEYMADSARVTQRRDTTVRTYTVASTARPLPLSENMFVVWAETIRRLAPDAKSATFLGGRGEFIYELRRNGDRIELINPDFGPIVAVLDGEKRLATLDMTGTTDKYVVTRAASIDVDAIAARGAARDAQGNPAGLLSPRDTARAMIGNAHVSVDYGRPSMRGRKIFGGIVPWQTLWRTGANQATQLMADRELEIGGATVPAGTYTLWTIPAPSGWKLVINRQHGQWGTVYDPAQDLARVDLPTERVSTPVERFTIEVTPTSRGGVLTLVWENTRARIPFTVK